MSGSTGASYCKARFGEFYRLLDGVVLDDARLVTTKLQEWEDFYNFDRPHGALGGQTPYERLRQKTGALV
jgi:transposase InsO family protein